MRDTDPVSAPDANDQTTVLVEAEWCDRGPISIRDKDPVNVQDANDQTKIPDTVERCDR